MLTCMRGKSRHLASYLMLAAMTAAPLASASAPQVMPLYEGEIPNSIPAPDEEAVGDSSPTDRFLVNVSRPTLSVYLPAARDTRHAAVIILPGGGYTGLSMIKEGHKVAEAFNQMGVAAVVLKYRTPSDRYMKNRTLGPLQDVQQAIRVVRQHADEWKIAGKRIGLVGFSAGGHLAATAGTHFDRPVLPEWRDADLRPDFLVLVYPVISFTDEIAHRGSRENLLGPHPSAAMIRLYSNELQVTSATPPAFIVHAADDTTVPVANSIRFFEALHAHGVRAELIVYPAGQHGFGLENSTTSDRWIERCKAWLRSEGWISGSQETE